MKSKLHVAALAVALSACGARAQSLSSSSPEPELTRQEALARADQLFTRFDLNGDGVVTRDEAQQVGSRLMLIRAKTGVDSAHGLGGHTLRFLRAQFAGMDAVNKQQFEQAFLRHFDQMDTNHDGILTAAERQASQQ